MKVFRYTASFGVIPEDPKDTFDYENSGSCHDIIICNLVVEVANIKRLYKNSKLREISG